jgi:beta-xylosidase
MYYTANEHIAVATSTSPLGPFTQKVKKAMHPETKEIDPHVYLDDNDKGYFYFVRFDKGNKVYGAELNADLQSINEKSIRLCIDQSQDWEIASGKEWPVTEAPAVLKHKGTYYLFYSGNDVKHANYNMGYATSKSPLGPWKKFENNPLISETQGVPGTAGGDFLIDSDQNIYLFYHQHFSDQQFSPRSVLFNKCVFREDETSAGDLFKLDTVKFYPKIQK